MLRTARSSLAPRSRRSPGSPRPTTRTPSKHCACAARRRTDMRGQGHWSELLPEETLSREEATRVLRRLWRLLKPYYGAVAFASVLVVLQAAALLGGPYLVKYGIDHGLPHVVNHRHI